MPPQAVRHLLIALVSLQGAWQWEQLSAQSACIGGKAVPCSGLAALTDGCTVSLGSLRHAWCIKPARLFAYAAGLIPLLLRSYTFQEITDPAEDLPRQPDLQRQAQGLLSALQPQSRKRQRTELAEAEAPDTEALQEQIQV